MAARNLLLTHFRHVSLVYKYKCTCKTSLKIPKWQSEAVNQRRSDNTMTNGQWKKDKKTIHYTLSYM